MSEPPNNRFKGPVLLLMAAVGLFDLVVGLIGGPWWVIVGGLLVFTVSLLSWRAVRRGRNPWWLRSPLDGHPETQKRRLLMLVVSATIFGIAIRLVLRRLGMNADLARPCGALSGALLAILLVSKALKT